MKNGLKLRSSYAIELVDKLENKLMFQYKKPIWKQKISNELISIIRERENKISISHLEALESKDAKIKILEDDVAFLSKRLRKTREEKEHWIEKSKETLKNSKTVWADQSKFELDKQEILNTKKAKEKSKNGLLLFVTMNILYVIFLAYMTTH